MNSLSALLFDGDRW